MSAGTISLTNGSATVNGSGTSFTSDLKIGDFITATVGGVVQTLGVSAIDSNTSLTLAQVFNGPTATDLAWVAIPNATLVGITAQLAAQVTYAIRGLNLDKNNWQQIFTGTGDVTVKLADDSSWTGPAWRGITDLIASKAAKGANNDITSLTGLTTALSIAQGGTGSKTAADALTALGAIPKAGGTMTGSLAFSSAALGRQTAGNLGFSSPASNRIIIPFNGGAFLIQMVTAVSTASSGNISFNFPQAFNSISTVLGTSGDANVSSGPVTTLNQSNTGVDFRILRADGSLAAGTCRVNYIAMGTIN